MTDKLLPCPFCGSTCIDEIMRGRFACDVCGASAMRWNTRALSAQPAEPKQQCNCNARGYDFETKFHDPSCPLAAPPAAELKDEQVERPMNDWQGIMGELDIINRQRELIATLTAERDAWKQDTAMYKTELLRQKGLTDDYLERITTIAAERDRAVEALKMHQLARIYADDGAYITAAERKATADSMTDAVLAASLQPARE